MKRTGFVGKDASKGDFGGPGGPPRKPKCANCSSETKEDKEFIEEEYLANISYEAIEDEEMIDNTGNTASDILNPNIVGSNNKIEDSLAPEDMFAK